MPGVFLLKAGFQQYDWGKLGSDSAVARYALATDPDLKIDNSKPYAELWMGTHPRMPCQIKDKTLTELIKSDPKKYLGEKIVAKYGADGVPFLFKVLSIEKVLSIQAHPDKTLGAILHSQDPQNYPDANHKPEMAIAITSFEGFCGFKPLEQIALHLQHVPEFREMVGNEIAEEFISNIKSSAQAGSPEDKTNRKLLQKVFNNVMSCDEARIATLAEKLMQRAQQHPKDFDDEKLPELLIRLNKQFPLDIGLFCGGLMLNHVFLKPGEGIFLKAKDPHAYINGDIIECMAASDNVVRAGFTPKFKDVKNLVEMLTYSYGSVEDQKMVTQNFSKASGDGQCRLFNPPIEEFNVLEVTFPRGPGKTTFKEFEGPSIMIVTEGHGKLKSLTDSNIEFDCLPGFVYYIAPNVELELIADEKEFTTYRAYCEV